LEGACVEELKLLETHDLEEEKKRKVVLGVGAPGDKG
jgi:hypothetical protein